MGHGRCQAWWYAATLPGVCVQGTARVPLPGVCVQGILSTGTISSAPLVDRRLATSRYSLLNKQ